MNVNIKIRIECKIQRNLNKHTHTYILPGPIHVKPNCWANEVPALVPTSCFQTAAGMNMFMFKLAPFGNGSHAPSAP